MLFTSVYFILNRKPMSFANEFTSFLSLYRMESMAFVTRYLYYIILEVFNRLMSTQLKVGLTRKIKQVLTTNYQCLPVDTAFQREDIPQCLPAILERFQTVIESGQKLARISLNYFSITHLSVSFILLQISIQYSCTFFHMNLDMSFLSKGPTDPTLYLVTQLTQSTLCKPACENQPLK